MNPVIENIKARRSVRLFDGRKIDKKTLEALIDAARWAPTGMNSQPWRFVVAQGDEFRKKLSALALPRYKKWLEKMPQELKAMRQEVDEKTGDPAYYGAPVVVFVIGKGMTSDFDCAMACQNIMLAARSLGIGSCWVYIGQLPLDDAEMRGALELKEGEKVYGPLVLGYPKGNFPAPPPKKDPPVKWL
ncbi:MAG TPA: nitroreductase [Elusimicrobiota bacterium]|nr:nitroreductase [Elusimicrobiota bacterium]